LVQGLVPRWKVTDPMFFMVSNTAPDSTAVFRAVPYAGPVVQLAGPQPYETVSNIINLQATVTDLSGVSGELYNVDVDGIAARYALGQSNAITLDTHYNPAGYSTIYLSVMSTNTQVFDPTNFPGTAKLNFSGVGSLFLDFENDTYLAFASDNASPSIGTNYILFVIDKAQQIQATISNPSNGQTVASYSGYVPYPATIEIPWNFTEADHVTPYTNDYYIVNFVAYDPTTLNMTNKIDRTGVRTGAGCFLTYMVEDPADPTGLGPFLNTAASTWIENTLKYLYNNIYNQSGLTQYYPFMVGTNRNIADCYPRNQWSSGWDTILSPYLPLLSYSDLTFGPSHGSGMAIGGGPNDFLPGTFDPHDLKRWIIGPVNTNQNWRLRKAALWTCYSGSVLLTTAGGVYPTWADACGIRPNGQQETSYMRKNAGLLFGGEVPQGGYANSPTSAAQVEATLDQIWVAGKYMYPGGCDPTYSFAFAINATRGMFNPQLDLADPRLFGYQYMIYSSVYDDELLMLNTSHVKTQ
jgi:hypothetical protein